MTVREILGIVPNGTVVQVLQTPIARFDKCESPVERQMGSVETLIHSNQNYLDYEAVKLEQRAGLMAITCTANAEQERATVLALYQL